MLFTLPLVLLAELDVLVAARDVGAGGLGVAALEVDQCREGLVLRRGADGLALVLVLLVVPLADVPGAFPGFFVEVAVGHSEECLLFQFEVLGSASFL